MKISDAKLHQIQAKVYAWSVTNLIILNGLSLKLVYYLIFFLSLHKSQFQLALSTLGAASQRVEQPTVRAVETAHLESLPHYTLQFNPQLFDFFSHQNKNMRPNKASSFSKTE